MFLSTELLDSETAISSQLEMIPDGPEPKLICEVTSVT
jgi:hypothetical protein